MKEVPGIEVCLTHRGVMTEGTDYHPDGWGCEYPEEDHGDEPCIGAPMYYVDTPSDLSLDGARRLLEGFGLHLARVRTAAGYSTRSLASEVNLRHDIITRIERGAWMPTLDIESTLRDWMVHHSESDEQGGS